MSLFKKLLVPMLAFAVLTSQLWPASKATPKATAAKIDPVAGPVDEKVDEKSEKITPFLAAYDQKVYSIIEPEFEALRKTINHKKVAELTQQIEEQEKKLAEEEALEEEEEAVDSENKHAQTITELKAQIIILQSQRADEHKVFLTKDKKPTKNALIAPTIYKILKDIVEETAIKSKITMPDIAVHLTPLNNHLSSDALSAAANWNIVSNHHIHVGEEFFKLCMWNRDALELLRAILSHEIGHLKIWDAPSLESEPEENPYTLSRQNEHEADAFAVSILDQPEMLIKAINLLLLEVMLNQVIHRRTKYPLQHVAKISRALANYCADTIPNLGTLGNATTNTVLADVLSVIIRQVKIRTPKISTSEDTLNVIFDLAHGITEACSNTRLIKRANLRASNATEMYPGPLDRRRHIETCIVQKKLPKVVTPE